MGAETCTTKNFSDQMEGNTIPVKSIEEVLNKNTKELMSLPGVVGVAQGVWEGKPCIIVYVTKKEPSLVKKIPDILEGYQIIIEETGEFKALPKDQD